MYDRLLASAARTTHGILTPSALDAVGMSDRQLKARLSSGQLIRLHNNVVAIAGAPQTWNYWATAALTAVPRSVLAETSAARLAGIDLPGPSLPIVILAPWTANHRLPGVTVRRSRTWHPHHLTERSGFATTTLERTLIDLGSVLSLGRLRAVIDDELGAKRTTLCALTETFSEVATRGRKGTARVRQVLEELDGEPPTESTLERAFLAEVRSLIEGRVATQATAPWAEREPGRVDFLFEKSRLIVELDGRRWHGRAASFELDRWRDQQAAIHGYRTVRFTHRQVTTQPDYVRATMAALLDAPTFGTLATQPAPPTSPAHS
ncbi:MAG: endonuclease domain-containing protein [Microthrixaceae bacterium]|nr:endonuclease domain-containing protein [Microthrixaceae bacterium]